MNISPIISNFSYIMYEQTTDKQRTAVKDFQQYLIETVYGPSFIPDESFVDLETEEEEAIFQLSPVEKDLYNQMMRSSIAKQLVNEDVFQLEEILSQQIKMNSKKGG